ncbi:MAG TPA: hypothetical protein VFK69_03430, partial [Candidatus Eisenbacteria bacterium]|nr:hypothetical protein [Candidatus Eisenbacteria bacterium]
DACDTSPPAAATTLTATCDPNHQDRWTVSWTEVADDDTLSKTGRVQWYDVRRSGSHITSDNWAQADQAGTPNGVAPDGTASVTLDITASTYVRLEAVDDNANWSGLSNEVLLPYGNYDCSGGGMFAGGGGGGGAQVRGARSASLARSSGESLTNSFEENSVLDAAALDQPSEDALRMDWLAADGNGYGVRLREPGGRGASVDQVSLLAVDHPAGTVSYRIPHGTLLGTLSTATLAQDQGGQDVTGLIDGSGSSYVGDSGAVVRVQTSADSTKGPVVVESCSGGLGGSRIVVETQGAAGDWAAAGTIVPRVRFDQQVIDSVPAGPFRLRFLGPCTVRLAARLLPGTQAPTEQWCALSAAAAANGSDVREALSARDSVSAVLSGADTLSLAFAAPSQVAGTTRDLFLVVDGTPLTASMATRAKQAAEASPLPRSFALRQNQPNPFHGATAIHFDLPVGQMVRLEIFDAQGRRVRTLANRFYPAGSHVASWDQRDDGGVALRPGLCFYRIETQAFRDRKKMVILP